MNAGSKSLGAYDMTFLIDATVLEFVSVAKSYSGGVVGSTVTGNQIQVGSLAYERGTFFSTALCACP